MTVRACTVPGCVGGKYHARGLCRRHYKAARRADPSSHAADLEAERARRQRPEVRAANRISSERYLHSEKGAAYRENWKKTHSSQYLKSYDTARLRSPERQAERRSARRKRRSRLAGIDPAGIRAAEAAGLRQQPCAKCDAPGPNHIDHVLPLSWADVSEVAAVLAQSFAFQPLCARCNSQKRDYRVECYVPTGDIGA